MRAFTRLMAEIKTALGPGRTVSCDVDVWGYHHAYYAFQLWPNADAAMVNAGALDWVNTMSYHWNKGGADYAPIEFTHPVGSLRPRDPPAAPS